MQLSNRRTLGRRAGKPEHLRRNQSGGMVRWAGDVEGLTDVYGTWLIVGQLEALQVGDRFGGAGAELD